ncbi:MAG: aminoacetone oxidase family FAD-binding enzyme [Ruminococcus flavefaciens]|nr:aminoacetone oxidase family FAD-binding enzyme [Ruminococcus flavefaciens]MCM1061217.1 aminoacetone oxidase family FAD-binding enzyme [Eubacterium sp.]
MYADIVVIGGGAAGMAAAISAKKARPSAKIIIAERLDRVGRKLLSTGNGRCNLSNQSILPEHYHGSVRNIMKIIDVAPSAEEFFMDMGVLCCADDQGRIYPRSMSAATVLSALRMKLSELDITEICGFDFVSIEKGKIYEIVSSNGDKISCRKVIIAAGGYAAPQLGTDGSVMRIFRERGYKTAKICPSVAPLRVSPESVKGLKGVRAKGCVAAFSGGKKLKEEFGEIQFTENSLSGICVFNLARLFQQYEGSLTLQIDFAPDMTPQQIIDYLNIIKKQRAERSVDELLTGFFAKNLAVFIVKNAVSRSLTDKTSTLKKDEIINIAKKIKGFQFSITGSSPWKNAQVTAGGIHGDCVDERLESKLDRGIFFCGEILDADGDCGGFNLQWAWSSGLWAGKNCAESLIGERL